MGILSIIGMIIVGFIVGVLARWTYPGTISMGFWATVVVGVIGSLVGGVLGSLMFRTRDGRELGHLGHASSMESPSSQN